MLVVSVSPHLPLKHASHEVGLLNRASRGLSAPPTDPVAMAPKPSNRPAILSSLLRALTSALLAICLIMSVAVAPVHAQRGLPLIRDAEIEGLLRLYTRDIFKAAGLNPRAIRVHLINANSINAFVAGGQRIFVHTGLLEQTSSPNEVIGVLAHETAHIAGGHLARLGIQVDKLSTASIIGMLIGAAAIAGAAASGQRGAASAGQGVIAGSQSLTHRSLLSYVRVQESAADQAAVKYLTATGHSGRGMLELFHRLASKSLGSLRYVDPYAISHPMPFERIRNLEKIVKATKYYKKEDHPAYMLRHQLMQAKLAGFLSSPQAVYQRYPVTDNSLPARYARSIAAFRRGDLKNALPVIDGMIKDIPRNPYFYELKGQALLESGKPRAAIKPLKHAAKLLPNNGLIRILLGQAQLNAGNAKAAIATLNVAKRSENDQPRLHLLMASAYGELGNLPRAELSAAEAAMITGDKELALQKSARAIKGLKRGTPQWLRANDILNFARQK